MKESVRSLKWYFVFMGFISILNLVQSIGEGINPDEGGFIIGGIILAIWYLVAGMKLKYFLLNRVGFLYALIGLSVLLSIFGLISGLTEAYDPIVTIVGLVFFVAFIWIPIYLYFNIKRLVAEERLRLENPELMEEKNQPKVIGGFTKTLLITTVVLIVSGIGLGIVGSLTS